MTGARLGIVSLLVLVASADDAMAQPIWPDMLSPKGEYAGCYIMRDITADTAIILGRRGADGSVSMLVQHDNLALSPGETIAVWGSLNTSRSEFRATADFAPDVIELHLDAQNGDGITEAIMWSERFSFELSGNRYFVTPEEMESGLVQLDSCYNNPNRAQMPFPPATPPPPPPAPGALAGALQQFSQVPNAGYTCYLRAVDLLGFAWPADNQADPVQFQVMDDASLRVNGVSIAALEVERQAFGGLSSAIYDSSDVRRAIVGRFAEKLAMPGVDTSDLVQLDAYINQQFETMMDGKLRYLIVNPSADQLTFFSLDAANQPTNVSTPQCLRTL